MPDAPETSMIETLINATRFAVYKRLNKINNMRKGKV